jgi:hypothetical protein
VKTILLTILVLLVTLPTAAQTYVGGGLNIIRSSSYDPSPLKTGDGGKVYVGGYAEGAYQFPLGLQARFLGEYNSDVALRSIFTSDTNVGKLPTAEFRFRPELRLRPTCGERIFCLFIGGGVDYYRQRFVETKKYSHEDEYDEPASGLNPFLTIGAEFGKNHEASFSRLFTDKTSLNNSQLHGYRAGYSYTKPITNHLHFKVAGEADYVIYRDSIGYYVATYTKRDAVFKGRVGLIFK